MAALSSLDAMGWDVYVAVMTTANFIPIMEVIATPPPVTTRDIALSCLALLRVAMEDDLIEGKLEEDVARERLTRARELLTAAGASTAEIDMIEVGLFGNS